MNTLKRTLTTMSSSGSAKKEEVKKEETEEVETTEVVSLKKDTEQAVSSPSVSTTEVEEK